ncbi:MAG: aminotransferase class I/II-fold pyridoxal phosphate-dependent enzyme, partial [Planctomycetota bacterium]
MPIMQSPPGCHTTIDGRQYLYFAGTGYLGLQGHPEVIRAACQATQKLGIGSATSRTGFGNTPPVLEVERRCAELFAVDDAFYFASGYMTNNILVRMLERGFQAVFVDELSHYCVFEAARLAAQPVFRFRFRHRDAEDLRAKLRANLKPGQLPLIMSDGVFAARGTIAPLAEYRAVISDYPGSVLCVDDAHALGVLGVNGRGTLEHTGLFNSAVNSDMVNSDTDAEDEPRLLLGGTLSKAIGGFGGIIPGSRSFIERLKATSHYYGGASAPPAPAAAATARALDLVKADRGMRTRLWKNVGALKNGLRRMGLEADHTPVPIVCLTLGDAGNMQRIQRELMSR